MESVKSVKKDISKDDPKVRTFYFYGDSENAVTRIIAAFYNDDTNYYVGFSLCSPKDNFCRAKGRTIAVGRLNKKPTWFSRVSDRYEIVDSELERAFKDKYKNVSWVRKHRKYFELV
jgi:hypothetical protein